MYEGLEKSEFIAPNRNLASRCTVGVEFPRYDEPLYTEIINVMRGKKDEANATFGTKLLANPTARASVRPPSPPPIPNVHPATPNMAELLDGFAKKALNESNSKSLTGTERERASEAADVSRFYSILFASSIDIIQDDGTTATSILPATIHPLFTPVLLAHKNTKATKFMQDAVESARSILGNSDDKFASNANLNPKMFDQPLTAALRTG